MIALGLQDHASDRAARGAGKGPRQRVETTEGAVVVVHRGDDSGLVWAVAVGAQRRGSDGQEAFRPFG